MSPNLRGAAFALVAFGLYATHDAIVKTLGGIYSPIQIVFFSVLLSFPLATLMMMRDAKPGTLLPVHPWWMALRTGAAVATGVSAFYAFSVLPLAQTYAILFATPLLITVLAIPILGERVRVRRWMAVGVGLIGVIIVLRPGGTVFGMGHAAAIVAAVCGAVATIIVRKIGSEERAVVLLLYPLVANFVVMGTALGFVYVPMEGIHFGMIAFMSALAWIGSRLSVAAYTLGQAAVVAPMQYSQILWATLYGFLFFDETVDGRTLLGTTIIIASGLYIVFRESRNSESQTPVLRTRSRPFMPSTPRIGTLLRLRGQTPPKGD